MNYRYQEQYEESDQISVKSISSNTNRSSRTSSNSKQSSGRSSARSSNTVEALKAKVNAEKARVNRDFVQKEAELRKQQIKIAEQEIILKAKSLREQQEIDIDLQVLDEERTCAEAEAEADVYQNYEEQRSSRSVQSSKIPKEIADPVKRTRAYIDSIATSKCESDVSPKQHMQQSLDPTVSKFEPRFSLSHVKTEFTYANEPEVKTEVSDNQYRDSIVPNVKTSTVENKFQNKTTIDNACYIKKDLANGSGESCISSPVDVSCQNDGNDNDVPNYANVTQQNSIPAYVDFTRYLMKKDLAITRLTNFNDRPDTYLSWKASFQSVMKEAEMNDSEEIDLLVKWLGPVSSKHACSIRSTNAFNPELGRQQLWERLDERYGSPEIIEAALREKIEKFPRLTPKDNMKLYELVDILVEIQAVKQNPAYSSMLAFYDSAIGINQIIVKLPARLQYKWIDRAASYKRNNGSIFPPFQYLVKFVQEMTTVMNDPGLNFTDTGNGNAHRQPNYNNNVKVRKTDVENDKYKKQSDRYTQIQKVPVRQPGNRMSSHESSSSICPIHNAPHSLNDCKTFSRKPIEERRQFLRENRICYKCCDSDKHMARNCNIKMKCSVCGSVRHSGALHDLAPIKTEKETPKKEDKAHGGESSESVTSMFTDVCSSEFQDKSCAKILQVSVFPKRRPQCSVKVYAILDDQSNRTLASPELLNALDVHGPEIEYTLSSCSGNFKTSGRRAQGFIVKSADGTCELELPVMIECCDIPNDHAEIPTPEVANYYSHLKEVADDIPPLDTRYQIGLLIGRDLISAHHIQRQVTGPKNTPFAQKLTLGWVIIGNTCLGKVHQPTTQETSVQCFRTHVIQHGRESIFEPCKQRVFVKEDVLSTNIFAKTRDDEKIGWSREDKEFYELMIEECKQSEDGFWIAPLPFRTPKQHMPNNLTLARKRAMALDASLKRDPVKCRHMVEFMGKIFESGAAEVAPDPKGEVWYLPLFGVYNPKKPGKIRGVFDSSADYKGVSLNSILIPGPNLTNSLLYILLKFRKNAYAVSGDIEQMFYRFLVKEEHRDYLRFLWYRDNDPRLDLIEYRMRAHVFGNSPSPSVATFALRKAVETADDDVKQFVTNEFYVDDALTSRSKVAEAIDIVKKTQKTLLENGHIRLHKIISNNAEIMHAFPEADLGEDLKSLNLEQDALPVQHSLGMSWDLNTDTFKFEVKMSEKTNTRRKMLSILNSVFDPIGYLSPFIIHGRILLRELTSETTWDEVLPEESLKTWERWKISMTKLNSINLPRMFIPISLNDAKDIELHIYSDASEKAVAAVAYIKAYVNDKIYTGFAMGKAKLAPAHGHTIPRLELCAAVLAVEIGESLSEALEISQDKIHYYSDSRVILGYIDNKVRRFYIYVANRVARILRSSNPQQWTYVPTQKNPADQATRTSMTLENFDLSLWLKGPDSLRDKIKEPAENIHHLVDPSEDKEVRPQIKISTKKTMAKFDISDRFEKFSNWKRLVAAITLLKTAIRKFKQRKSKDVAPEQTTEVKESENFIIKQIQNNAYLDEISEIKEGKSVNKASPISSLNPILDNKGILRVGGRLNNSDFPLEEVNPVILPSKCHVSKLLVTYYHEKVQHQGRLITEGSVRSNGYWIIGAKRLVSNIVYKCVTCRKLRGKMQWQQMADLPQDRLQPGPPFTSVGIDTFGPWSVVTRKTRGGSANAKRWAIMFTCLTTRAVHIEVIEEMSTSSFINALRRFVALRGNVQEIRSDCGTNFVGATKELQIEAIRVTDGNVADYLKNSDIIWKFNPPHSSHMGGVWQRMIGIARRILDSMLLGAGGKTLTHEVLVTFMSEVCAIMNSRPICPISSDPQSPMIISPAILLNQKMEGDNMIQQTFDIKDLYKTQWRRVQALSDMFWKEWKQGYLQTLQTRRKWKTKVPDLKNGDVVLLKDKDLPRMDWRVGVIVNAVKSESDDKVRKAEIRIAKDGAVNTYTRPVTDMILLIEK